MGQFATGVTVITTRDAAGNLYGLTANAVTPFSLVPPLVVICVDRNAESFVHFYDSKRFVVNILAEQQQEVSARFAKSGGDKFTGVAYRLGPHGTAVLDGALAHLDCRIVATHEGGDHVLHVGEVEHAEVAGGSPLRPVPPPRRRLSRRGAPAQIGANVAGGVVRDPEAAFEQPRIDESDPVEQRRHQHVDRQGRAREHSREGGDGAVQAGGVSFGGEVRIARILGGA